jgi:hypothetical protein
LKLLHGLGGWDLIRITRDDDGGGVFGNGVSHPHVPLVVFKVPGVREVNIIIRINDDMLDREILESLFIVVKEQGFGLPAVGQGSLSQDELINHGGEFVEADLKEV